MGNSRSKQARLEAQRRARRQKVRRQQLMLGAMAVVVVGIVAAIVLFSGGSDDAAGALAPDFELETPDGEAVKLSDYRGKPVALTFMHTY